MTGRVSPQGFRIGQEDAGPRAVEQILGMRITSKITFGYAILIGLMILVLIYQVVQIHRMQAINQNLSQINTRALDFSAQLGPDLWEISRTTQVFFIVGDLDYLERLNGMRSRLDANLRQFQDLDLSEEERTEISHFSSMWREYIRIADEQDRLLKSMDRATFQQALEEKNLDVLQRRQIENLDDLIAQSKRVVDASQQAIRRRVEQSKITSLRVEWVSLSAGGMALFLSFLVSVLIVRSISRPLGQLSRATRILSTGDFTHQIEVKGEDELSQLGFSFNMMVQRLNELDELKKDFVSHVSHELKAPLASIQETIRVLLERIPGPLNEKQERLLSINLQSGKRLHSMIGNLLDLSRMEVGAMQYETKTHDLVDLVKEVVQEFESLFQEKGLLLEAEYPEYPVAVECDGQRMAQVIGNLLNNARKFAPMRSRITVSVQRLAQVPWQASLGDWTPRPTTNPPDGFALLSVSDQGPGVPDEHKEKIFEKFHQVKQGTKLSGQGTGLGLAISRSIVQAHGGHIWVEDNAGGGGSVFQMLLRSVKETEKSGAEAC